MRGRESDLGRDTVRQIIPKAFFVTGGKAVSKVSRLNTFDLALKEAGIAQCNLVRVSSIIPPHCEETEVTPVPAGSITYAVISKCEGTGQKISTGIAWSVEGSKGYSVVAEAYGCMDAEITRRKLKKKIMEMAKVRDIELGEIKYRTETLDVPEDSYGCVVAALVYIP